MFKKVIMQILFNYLIIFYYGMLHFFKHLIFNIKDFLFF